MSEQHESRPMKGPRRMGVKPTKAGMKSLGKVVAYVLKEYKLLCLFVVLGIIASALVTLAVTMFMQSLIDDYILPLSMQANPDFAPLAARLFRLAGVA